MLGNAASNELCHMAIQGTEALHGSYIPDMNELCASSALFHSSLVEM